MSGRNVLTFAAVLVVGVALGFLMSSSLPPAESRVLPVWVEALHRVCTAIGGLGPTPAPRATMSRKRRARGSSGTARLPFEHGGCDQNPGCTRASRLVAAPSLYGLRVNWSMNCVKPSRRTRTDLSGPPWAARQPLPVITGFRCFPGR